MEITSIGLGSWAIGGHTWGGQDDDESIAAIHAALVQRPELTVLEFDDA